MLIFVDDVILVSDTIRSLQHQINILGSYAAKWGVTFNLEKNNVVFRRGGNLSAIAV